eukprot:CAMPEP_0170479892 /NCGR_PEP_ID=MMETSP0208-20121228/943_1 /TAXON_ID=197538 /ORGANISM="Strombidium inclinatum, Strain S3" /LENGTH=382 /DNA_ID=CAMNT_0010752353 /DNA_START=122 /DNA_END=1266 /DNA_ORIENTATION=+
MPQIFKDDPSTNKVNLGIGTYRDDNGKVAVFDVIRKAEKMVVEDITIDKEYLPIDGDQGFIKTAQQSLFGFNNPEANHPRIASFQTLSGSGALRTAADFLSKYRSAPIYISDPTWENHLRIFNEAGLLIRRYRYIDPKTRLIDMPAFLADLRAMTAGSCVLFQTCGHNPTGVDPSLEQWKQIIMICKERGLFPIFDNTYQGFASGDHEEDAKGPREFLRQGCEFIVAQSFAKNLGLYGERVGATHIICNTHDAAKRVLSVIKVIVRASYSSPPKHGSKIAALVLGKEDLRHEWYKDLKGVADRMSRMRVLLRDRLHEIGTPGNWDFITKQSGFFAFLGLSERQCETMVKKHHVHMQLNSRISLTGMQASNVDYVAKAIKDVV